MHLRISQKCLREGSYSNQVRKYILTTPKDDHGQPIALFKLNLENNVSKAIDQLSGICSGILADGAVTDTEAQLFCAYVRKFGTYEPVWPFTDILARIQQIFADGRCGDDEREELKTVMEALCGHCRDTKPSETYSAALPLNSPPPDAVIFSERNFVITGRFAFGTRRKVMEAITDRLGIVSDSFPTRESHYLVIGTFASRDWANTNFGRKIERAVELRDSGSGICIISEEYWHKFLTPSDIPEPKLRIASNGQDLGEVSVATVKQMLKGGQLTPQDYFLDVEANEWVPLDRCTDLG